MNNIIFNKYRRMKCTNCGKLGHSHKECRDPITSYGILAIKIENQEIFSIVKEALEHTNSIYRTTINEFHSNIDFELFAKYREAIQFLLIMRKHTLGYIEFVRGRYNVTNINYISYLFKQMMPEEIEKIKTKDFEYLWKDVCGTTEPDTSEFHERSFQKYKQLQTSKISLADLIKTASPMYDCPEWGIPKGRRIKNESDFDCAKREFTEETGYTSNDYVLFENIRPFIENITGTNGINYRHVYFIALLTSNQKPFYVKPDGYCNFEVGSIGFYTIDTAVQKIREYFSARRGFIFSVFARVINSIIRQKT